MSIRISALLTKRKLFAIIIYSMNNTESSAVSSLGHHGYAPETSLAPNAHDAPDAPDTPASPESLEVLRRPEDRALDALTFEAITALRDAQRHAFYDGQETARQQGMEPDAARAYGTHSAAESLNNYIRQSVAETLDPELKAAATEAMTRSSFLSMSDLEWRTGIPAINNDSWLPGHERLETTRRALIDAYGEKSDAPAANVAETPLDGVAADSEGTPVNFEVTTADSEAIVDPAIEGAREHLATLRERVATLSAKRQGRLLGRGGAAYETALAEYNAQVTALGKLQFETLLADETVSAVDKNAAVVNYLFEQQNELRRNSLAALTGTKMHTFITKYADFMRQGGRTKRLLKSVTLGVGLGLAAGAAIGATGGAAAVGIGAALAGTKLVRAYAMNDAKKGRGMTELSNTQRQLFVQRHDAATQSIDALQSSLTDTFEDDTKIEQQKRRRSAYVAMGTLAAGLALGELAHHTDILTHTANATDATPDTAETTPDTAAATPDTTPVTPEMTPDTPDVSDATESLDTTPLDTTPLDTEASFDADFDVAYGEGGIHLFQGLGLSEAQWYEVHHELLDRFGPETTGDFYSMGHGQVGLAHPGQLSSEAQAFITQYFDLK